MSHATTVVLTVTRHGPTLFRWPRICYTARVPPEDSPERLDARVTTVEVRLEGVGNELRALAASKREHDQGTAAEFARVSSEIANGKRPNWSLYVSASFLVLTLFSLGTYPAYLQMASLQKTVDQMASREEHAYWEVKQWQQDYMLGRIPSSSAPQIAELSQKFVEVETQFHGTERRFQENEQYIKERSEAHQRVLDEQRHALDELRAAVARLSERLGMGK